MTIDQTHMAHEVFNMFMVRPGINKLSQEPT